MSAFDLEALCEAHPELAQSLRAAFEDLRMLEDLAGSLDLGPRTVGGELTWLLAQAGEEEPPTGSIAAQFLEQFDAREEAARGYRYELREPVGKGGQGDVVRAWDPSLERELAIKRTLLPMSAALQSRSKLRALALFLNEARVTSQLDHPGIVPVHEVGRDPDGHAYFTMRLVRGSSLSKIIALARSGDADWTLPRLVGVVRGVCDAVAYAHSKGVLHRDLKPDNVMVGAFGEVQVMDWGMARVLGEGGRWGSRLEPLDEESKGFPSSRDALATRQGEIFGTPAYMPPEQALGKIDEMGLWSDVYSLGAMLYHVLEGHPPFVGHDESEDVLVVLGRVLDSRAEEHLSFSPETPPELLAIVRRAMARVPAERYPSVHALSEDLRAYLEGRVVATYRSDWVTALRKWSGRHRGLVRVAAAAMILVSFFAGMTWKAVRAAEGSDRTKEAQRILAVDLSKTVYPLRELEEDIELLRQRIERNQALLGEQGVFVGREGGPLPASLASFDFPDGPALEEFVLEAHYEEWRSWLMLCSHGARVTPRQRLTSEEELHLQRIREWISRHERSPFRQSWREAMEARQLRDDLEAAQEFLDSTETANWTDPRDLEAYAELAELSGRAGEAAATCNRVIELTGGAQDRPRTHALLAVLEKDWEARALHILEWARSDPHDPASWTVLGHEALKFDVFGEKAGVAAAAMELGGVMTNAPNLALIRPDDPAVELLIEYIEWSPSPVPMAFVNLALKASTPELVERALPYLELGIERYPDAQELQCNVGLLYQELEAHDKARACFVRAAASPAPLARSNGVAAWSANTNAGLEYHRAYMVGEKRDPDLRRRSLQYYQAALELKPQDAISNSNMARILTDSTELEDWELATSYVETAHSIGGDGSLGEVVRAMLGSLQADSSPEVVALFDRLQAVAVDLESEH